MIGRNDLCWCGSGNKWKKCHFPQVPVQKTMTDALVAHYRKQGILIKTPEQMNGIRAAGKLTAEILDKTCAMAKAGVTTAELDKYTARLCKEAGAIAAALHYGEPPFPKSICTSLNEVVCHGIPDDVPLKEGDIVNIDIATILNGYYGDCSQMVVIGKTTPERQLVVDTSYECLMKAIEILRPGIPVCAIGEAIENHATSKNCSVVYQFVGHGVGVRFHEGPQVAHFMNKNQTLLAPGMTFTIEPMINAGVPEAVIDPINHWTARTKDGRASGQWEHTLLITEDGYEILTPWKRKH